MHAGDRTVERRVLTMTLDALAIWSAGHIACLLCFSSPLSAVEPLYAVLLYFGVILAFAFLHQLFDQFAGISHANRVVAGSAALSCAILLGAALVLLTGLHDLGSISVSWIMSWYTIGTFFLILHRQSTHQILLRRYQNNKGIINVIIVGFYGSSLQLLEHARGHCCCGYKVKAIYTDEHRDMDEHVERLRNILPCEIIATFEQVASYVVTNDIQEVWVALPLSEGVKVSALREILRHEAVSIHWLPVIPTSQSLETRVVNVCGTPAFGFDQVAYEPLFILTKEVFDRVFAIAVLIALAPLLGAISIAIKLTSPGPLLFTQPRHGLNGKIFYIYKFRSMIPDAESKGFVQAVRNDRRITPLGAFIRRTSLDELPQFLNVLRGEMSVVGPRPHPLKLNDSVKEQLHGYMLRHRVKPGITGWAQIHGYRGETETLDKMAKRLQYDLEYIQNRNFLLDLKIIAWTACKGWTGKTVY